MRSVTASLVAWSGRGLVLWAMGCPCRELTMRRRLAAPHRGGPDAGDRTAVPADRAASPAAVLHRALVCDPGRAGHRSPVGCRPTNRHRDVQAAGLAGSVHWSRAHRFFARAVWDLDQVGLALARAVVARLVPDAGAVTVAVDDTLFHRYGKKVHGARYPHDGSAKGRDGIGRGNCFVIVGIVVAVPFLARQVCLPVLFRLHIPKTSASKTEQARALVDRLAQALPGRTIHVVGDAPYRGPVWRGLPARVTFTTRLAANAVLHRPEPARTGRRGHPAWKGERLGTAADMAATTARVSVFQGCLGQRGCAGRRPRTGLTLATTGQLPCG